MIIKIVFLNNGLFLDYHISMKELLRIFVKCHRTFLFIIMEVLCLILIINNNHFHRSVYMSSANMICGSFYDMTYSITSFFKLQEVNEELLLENTELRNQFSHKYNKKDSSEFLETNRFLYRNAHVINKSINNIENSITLDKGRKDGIKTEMAVISDKGVVGIISNVSEHYSTVLPIINQTLSISAKIKRNNFYGSLWWDGHDYRQALLKDIPFHADIIKGDSIITSGYSSIFPEGILIAKVDEYKHENGDNFLYIKVNLSVDYKTLENVYIIEYLLKNEQTQLEINQ